MGRERERDTEHCCMSGAAGKRGRRLLQLASIAGHTKLNAEHDAGANVVGHLHR